MHERQRQVEPALHPAGVAANLAVGCVGQPDALQQLGRARGAFGLRQPVQAALELEVLAPCQEVVERRLLQRRADPAAHVRALRGHVEAGDRRAARRRREQRREDMDRRRLACAVGPEEAVDLTGLDLKLDSVDSADGWAGPKFADQTVDRDAVVGHGGVR